MLIPINFMTFYEKIQGAARPKAAAPGFLENTLRLTPEWFAGRGSLAVASRAHEL